jgi:hypothetical protein
MHLAMSPLPVHLLGWTNPVTSQLLHPLALGSLCMPTHLLRLLSPVHVPVSLHQHNWPPAPPLGVEQLTPHASGKAMRLSSLTVSVRVLHHVFVSWQDMAQRCAVTVSSNGTLS